MSGTIAVPKKRANVSKTLKKAASKKLLKEGPLQKTCLPLLINSKISMGGNEDHA